MLLGEVLNKSLGLVKCRMPRAFCQSASSALPEGAFMVIAEVLSLVLRPAFGVRLAAFFLHI